MEPHSRLRVRSAFGKAFNQQESTEACGLISSAPVNPRRPAWEKRTTSILKDLAAQSGHRTPSFRKKTANGIREEYEPCGGHPLIFELLSSRSGLRSLIHQHVEQLFGVLECY
jgi:hypothetical protein